MFARYKLRNLIISPSITISPWDGQVPFCVVLVCQERMEHEVTAESAEPQSARIVLIIPRLGGSLELVNTKQEPILARRPVEGSGSGARMRSHEGC